MKKLVLSRRWLLTALLALGLAIPVAGLAGKGGNGNGGGGNGGGGGEDPPLEPPPITYMINIIEGFRVEQLNNQGDMLGADLVPNYELIYDGDSYLVANFFVNLPELFRSVNGLSDRAPDGSVFLCGSCFNVDGDVRGWTMLLSPDETGQLERTWFDIIDPLDGDNVTSAYSVNSYGETGANSAVSIDGGGWMDRTAIFVSPTQGTFTVGEASAFSHKVTESGALITGLYVGDTWSYHKWTINGGQELLVEGFVIEAEKSTRINNLGHMVGYIPTYTTAQNGETIETRTNYLFDGQLNFISQTDELPWFPSLTALNDYDDYISLRPEKGKGNRYRIIPEVYLAYLDQAYAIENLLDPANSQADIDAFKDGIDSHYHGINSAGVIVFRHYGNTSTFVLTPVPIEL